MKTKKIFSNIIWVILFLVTRQVSFAQQEPNYTQYMFNTQLINPAYAGVWQTTGVMALSRIQWVGIAEAPRTNSVLFQTPLVRNKNVGIGVNFLSDIIGFEKRLSLNADYSYKLKLNWNTDLRMGLKLGFTSYSNPLTKYSLVDSNDPTFVGNIDHKVMPNFGVGIFVSNPNYYIGFSVPKILNNEFKNNVNNFSTQAEIRHYFLIAGYIFEISPALKFKPTLLTKVTTNAPVQMDISANFLLKDKVWIGVMYRSGDAAGAIAQWVFNKKLRIGYSIDFTTSKLGIYNKGTHEVMVSYEIDILKLSGSTRYY